MRIGVGLPNIVGGTSGETMIEWARVADEGPFSSLAVLDRIRYDSYEPLATLAAAAAATKHIRLVSAVVIGPLRNTAILAKQAATIDALSGGRLTLGLAVGARPDDYETAAVDHQHRGKILTQQLIDLRKYWSDANIGPKAIQPGGPKILIGGSSDAAMQRMAAYADGYYHSGGPVRSFNKVAEKAKAAWAQAGRTGQPPLWSQAFFALSNAESGIASIRNYYGFTGAFVERVVAGLLTSAQAVREHIQAYEEAGCDELQLIPMVADVDELDLLAEAIE